MRYIDIDYLISVYVADITVDERFLPAIIAKAERDIEAMTNNQLSDERFEQLSEENQKNIKNAICAQVEFLSGLKAKYGTFDTNSIPDQFSIGAYSETRSRSNGKAVSAKIERYSDNAYFYLFPTGLLFKGVSYL